MAKGFIVVDMPDCCDMCSFGGIAHNSKFEDGECFCTLLVKSVDNIKEGEKPDWCPIHGFPKKRSEKDAYFPCDFYRTEGWNSCLKALEDATEVQNGKEDT